MKAGRELDAEVAEKVMGWTQVSHPEPEMLIVKPGLVWFPPGFDYKKARKEYGQGVSNGIYFPEYSTDIKAAWEVVEKLAEDRSEPHVIQIYGPLADGYKAEVIWEHHDGPIPVAEAIAETAPLAICLAALKSVSVE